MIKINKDIEKLDELAEKYYESLHSKLERRFNEETSQEGLFRELREKLKILITGRPDVLEQLKNDISRDYHDTLQQKTVKQKLGKIFNYSDFVRNHSYTHAELLGVPVCLYCNRQYTFTLKKKDKKTRPQFDHFFAQEQYPYLALSFFNLIPCCSICNCSFKGSKKFTYKKNAHPLVNDSTKYFRFKTNFKKVGDILEAGGTLNVEISKETRKVEILEEEQEREFLRFKENADTFALEALYSMHRDYVVEIVKKAYCYDLSMIKELEGIKRPDEQPLFVSKAEILNAIFANYLQKDKLGNRVLAKLTRDIVEEYLPKELKVFLE